MNQSRKNFIAGLVGNVLDRYDMALYGIMATFMAGNFFHSEDHIASVIKVYGIMALGIVTRPLGALFFGKLAMQIGARKVMIICLCGVAISTGLIGILPSYEQVGSFAPMLLIMVRIFQGFCASGENTIAPFFLINNSPYDKATRTSGIYNLSTMVGVVLASVSAAAVSMSDEPEFYWRIPYIFGFFTAVAGMALRSSIFIDSEDRKIDISFKKIVKIANKNRYNVLRVVLVSSFSYITYTIPFVFMNNFIPVITDISVSEMLQFNTILLVLDTALIPVFTIISENFDRKKFMGSMSIFLAITAIPLFYYLEGSSLIYVMFVRILIIFAGLAYIAPIYAWYYSLFQGEERYPMVGLGYSIGEVFIGRNSTAICLGLWYYFQTAVAPAIFITLLAIAATIALFTSKEIAEVK